VGLLFGVFCFSGLLWFVGFFGRCWEISFGRAGGLVGSFVFCHMAEGVVVVSLWSVAFMFLLLYRFLAWVVL